MSAMSPDHQRLRDALRRLDTARQIGLTNPQLRISQPHHAHAANGGYAVPTVAHIRTPIMHRYSTRTEAVIVKIARTKARRELWRRRLETATAFALIWIGVGIIGLAMFWVVGVLVRWFAVP